MNLKKKKTVLPLNGWPAWFDGKSINETLFCQHFLKTHAIIYTENAFFMSEGCMMDMVNAAGRRVWGFKGIGAVLHLNVETHDGWKTTWANTPFDHAASQ